MVGNENRKLIYKRSLSFFPDGTINTRDQILNSTLSLERDDNPLIEEYNALYKLIFQSNGGIDSAFNLGQENWWDIDLLEIFSTFRK